MTNPPDPAGFNEYAYLRTHRDVCDAVSRGEFASGREHFEKFGRAEGRIANRFLTAERLHFLYDYRKLVAKLIDEHPDDRPTAMARAVGSPTAAHFEQVGRRQAAFLLKEGLGDGMHVYDLGCGSGRTAFGLRLAGWRGRYTGSDIVEPLIAYARQTNENFDFYLHEDFSARAEDATIDLFFAWSLFTHLNPEETYLYLEDAWRVLKSGGLLMFSFLEPSIAWHWQLFKDRVVQIRHGVRPAHLDYFFDRAFIRMIAEDIGFTILKFTDGDDETATAMGNFGQSVVILKKTET
jgi:SAM-dependent methyltransferase